MKTYLSYAEGRKVKLGQYNKRCLASSIGESFVLFLKVR